MSEQADKINYADYCALRNARDALKQQLAEANKKLADEEVSRADRRRLE